MLRSFMVSMAWVVPLSVLIWIYAEGERTDIQQQSVPIQVRPPDGKMIAEVTWPPEKVVVATLRGTRSRLERVQRELASAAGISGVTVPLGADIKPGEYTFPGMLISNSPVFRDNSVTVMEVSPGSFKVVVDELMVVEADVVPPTGLRNLAGPPAFEPRTVSVSLPARLLESFDGRLSVTADFSRIDELNVAGVQQLSNVPIELPQELKGLANVTMSPAAVQASVEVTAPDAEYVIPSIAVFNVIPQDLEKRYQFAVTPQTLARVKVVGPSATIARMKQPDFSPQPIASVRISASDAGAGQIVRAVDFQFPQGVRLAVAAPPTVSVTLSPIQP